MVRHTHSHGYILDRIVCIQHQFGHFGLSGCERRFVDGITADQLLVLQVGIETIVRAGGAEGTSHKLHVHVTLCVAIGHMIHFAKAAVDADDGQVCIIDIGDFLHVFVLIPQLLLQDKVGRP